MVYCFECGEQVAENDVFCPYCGITLPPSTTGAKEETAPTANPAQPADNGGVSASVSQKNDFADDVTAENISVSDEDLIKIARLAAKRIVADV